jgi:hypothetical protein
MPSTATAMSPLYAGDVAPAEAWSALSGNPDAQLVDVRTQAEWSFAGVPSLASLSKTLKTISWKFYPNFDLNARFVEQLEAEGGFEGDINSNYQRGQVNGWKAARLPWQQA